MIFLLAYFTIGFILAVAAVAVDYRNRDISLAICLIWPTFVCVFLAHAIVAVSRAVRRAVE